MSQRVRTAVRVEGIVQGVGFRPFVYSLATGLGLGGLVGNDVDGVFAEVEGPQAAVAEFLARLRQQAPPLARIERITTKELPLNGSSEFSIAASRQSGPRATLVSADSAPCADCLAEFGDPADRRFRYPFINCTNCGPRFTIVRDVPYDRQLTTMAPFAMCRLCAAEYRDPGDRRFHAQPVCCPACGPRLRLVDAAGTELPGQPVSAAAALLRSGRIVAVKGLGGYHLAADAGSESAAAALRARKHREDKPFAVMVADVAAVRAICELDPVAEALLTDPRRPIVLLPRRDAGPGGAGPGGAGPGEVGPGPIAAAVAPGNRQLGVMLPYTPLHHLLIREIAGPMVLTSGNVSDEPIAYTDDDALDRLSRIADAFLTHDRAIHIRTDDSVLRAFRGRAALVRRSRGYAPEPLTVPVSFTRPVLACGAELKNTFCLGSGRHAFVSQHIGDLENAETLRSFTEGIEHFKRLFEIEPLVVACDLHPEYLSTKYAIDLAGPDQAGLEQDVLEQDVLERAGLVQDGIELTGVQHHHAHIASCLADNGVTGPVIGVAFDGTGYGTDGTIWGGEFLIAGLASFRRAGHLAPVPMPGGAAAIRQPWRMAAAYLSAAYPDGPPGGLQLIRRAGRRWDEVLAVARAGINSPVTSSAGRLFDAVAAILGVRDSINYEGQAAVELEQLADPAERGGYLAEISAEASEPLQLAGTDLIRAVCADLAAGVDRRLIAARFHNGLAGVIAEACELLRERTGLGAVALSGGVFQNLLLLNRVAGALDRRGFDVLLHSRVPCNDGGISLGQAVVAAARDESNGAG